jgi:hypothetical protein
MALGSTQPVTEMSTRHLPGDKVQPAARGADNLTIICELIVWKMWEPRSYEPSWPVTGICLPYMAISLVDDRQKSTCSNVYILVYDNCCIMSAGAQFCITNSSQLEKCYLLECDAM